MYMKVDVTKRGDLRVSFAAFANIFISAGTEIINIRAKLNPLSGKGTSMTCSPRETQKERKLTSSPLKLNRHPPTISSPAEISNKETNFLDTTIFKGGRFHKDSIFDICMHFKPTEKFQYTHYTSCHAPGVKKDL